MQRLGATRREKAESGMSKKRVHEVAKELKSFGIELDNKEVVQELVALGYDVKSHSSSLEDDQASAAPKKAAVRRVEDVPPAAAASESPPPLPAAEAAPSASAAPTPSMPEK